jgi:hypothetical protein
MKGRKGLPETLIPSLRREYWPLFPSLSTAVEANFGQDTRLKIAQPNLMARTLVLGFRKYQWGRRSDSRLPRHELARK